MKLSQLRDGNVSRQGGFRRDLWAAVKQFGEKGLIDPSPLGYHDTVAMTLDHRQGHCPKEEDVPQSRRCRDNRASAGLSHPS
jgi:hypothetical protein